MPKLWHLALFLHMVIKAYNTGRKSGKIFNKVVVFQEDRWALTKMPAELEMLHPLFPMLPYLLLLVSRDCVQIELFGRKPVLSVQRSPLTSTYRVASQVVQMIFD